MFGQNKECRFQMFLNFFYLTPLVQNDARFYKSFKLVKTCKIVLFDYLLMKKIFRIIFFLQMNFILFSVQVLTYKIWRKKSESSGNPCLQKLCGMIAIKNIISYQNNVIISSDFKRSDSFSLQTCGTSIISTLLYAQI